MVALVRLLLHNELDVPEVNLILGLVLILELVFDLLPELAKVEVPLLLHALHHQLHLYYLRGQVLNLSQELCRQPALWPGGSWSLPGPWAPSWPGSALVG